MGKIRAVDPIRNGAAAVRRNAECPCGSGKKFKHCHLVKAKENFRYVGTSLKRPRDENLTG